ncbi:hypothetical protein SAMN05444422_106180 [Halobiforma haloterrestris]|uniref:Small CPxCG-related zinc finger protein n=1 Tax=Natronobacterium haloterrestre TaxID=148448 RepID=A0A1I1HV72_NATHA|nr:hypothetical protein [Halobiforma haloterrestris]SFC27695.1 hypothetical protein SAMN05444422_106180 [Halobiforma haloterrestris]
MAKDSCDGCGRTVTVAGGIANIWTFGEDAGKGTAMTLEFEDGTEHLLCYPCIEALPDNPSAADVDRLEEVDETTSRHAGP